MCGSLEKRGDGDRQRDRQRDRETETDLDLRVLSDSFGAVGPIKLGHFCFVPSVFFSLCLYLDFNSFLSCCVSIALFCAEILRSCSSKASNLVSPSSSIVSATVLPVSPTGVSIDLPTTVFFALVMYSFIAQT